MKVYEIDNSGPYVSYHTVTEESAESHKKASVEVPDSVWERYEKAQAEYFAAEEALEVSIDLARHGYSAYEQTTILSRLARGVTSVPKQT